MKWKCPGIEIVPSVFNGCNGEVSCPVCEGKGHIINCPVCGEPVKSDGTCRNRCWYPLGEVDEKQGGSRGICKN